MLPDELLSSYLIRLAHAAGTTPTAFCSSRFRTHDCWNRDLDRAPPTVIVRSLPAIAKISSDQIDQLTLHTYESTICSAYPQWRQPIGGGVAPWLLVLGITHRIRRCGGLQFCPRCLHEAAYLRRAWRLAFVTTCVRHACRLLDQCPQCHAPYVPHRLDRSLTTCHVCAADLRRVTAAVDAGMQPIADAMAFQTAIVRGLQTGTVLIATQSVPIGDALRGIHLISRMTSLHARQAGMPSAISRTIERQSTAERVAAGTNWRSIGDSWPDTLLRTAARFNLTQRDLIAYAPWPTWMNDAIARLPPGRVCPGRHAPRTLRQRLTSLQRRHPPHWRSIRARLLLNARKRIT